MAAQMTDSVAGQRAEVTTIFPVYNPRCQDARARARSVRSQAVKRSHLVEASVHTHPSSTVAAPANQLVSCAATNPHPPELNNPELNNPELNN